MQNSTFLVLLGPIFASKMKTALPKGLEFGEDLFFFGDLLFSEKTLEFLISARKKLLNFGEDLFSLRSPNFYRKIASIQFKTNENLGQVRLRLNQTSKKAPPLRNPGYAPVSINLKKIFYTRLKLFNGGIGILPMFPKPGFFQGFEFASTDLISF